jgi:predicted nucleic acid-binding protein
MAGGVVVDANITLGLFLHLPYSEKAEQWMLARKGEGSTIAVPLLWEYECLSGLRKALALGNIIAEDAERLVNLLHQLEFRRVSPTPDLHRSALKWAERIGQSKTYDAHYLALAEELGVDFWTADRKLADAAGRSGAEWIHWIGEESNLYS